MMSVGLEERFIGYSCLKDMQIVIAHKYTQLHILRVHVLHTSCGIHRHLTNFSSSELDVGQMD